MPQSDAEHWNARYTGLLGSDKEFAPRQFLVEQAGYLPAQGLALDVATGLGGNANFLMAAGLRVVGVDISEIGLRASKARFPGLSAVVADLTCFYLPEHSFDVILNFYYLQRDLWPGYIRALRPGGLLFFETMTERMLEANPKINPDHLLAAGELRRAFSSLEILVYRETCSGPNEPNFSATAQLVARKL